MGLQRTWYCDGPNCGEFSDDPSPDGYFIESTRRATSGVSGQREFRQSLWLHTNQCYRDWVNSLPTTH